jgi:hypothetical protein
MGRVPFQELWAGKLRSSDYIAEGIRSRNRTCPETEQTTENKVRKVGVFFNHEK